MKRKLGTRTVFTVLLAVFAGVFSACENEDEASIESISIRREVVMTVDDTLSLTVSHKPAELQAPEYEWKSADNTIATVDENGLVRAVKVGETKVTVTAVDLGLSASCYVTVDPVKVESITMGETEKTVTVGDTITLSYSILPENTTYKEVKWDTSDGSIAVVLGDGRVAVIGDGECTVRVKLDGKAASCKLTANPAKVERIWYAEQEYTIEQKQTVELTLEYEPYYAKIESVEYLIEGEGYEKKVSDKGLTFAAELTEIGDYTVTATVNGSVSAKYTVHVTPISVKGVSLGVTGKAMVIGDSFNLGKYLTITPSDAANLEVTWSSEDPNIVSVDENGNITTKQGGSAIIRVTSADGGLSAICVVTAKEITEFMSLEISGNGTYIDGYILGAKYCYITNNSDKEVTLTYFTITDSQTNDVVMQGTDESLLGVLKPGATKNLGGNLRSVYFPIFTWYFEYEGQTYSVSIQYKSPFDEYFGL